MQLYFATVDLYVNVWSWMMNDVFTLVCLRLLCSYVWEHLEMGYVQGMCDLLAPLMVILDDGENKESL